MTLSRTVTRPFLPGSTIISYDMWDDGPIDVGLVISVKLMDPDPMYLVLWKTAGLQFYVNDYEDGSYTAPASW